MIDGVVQSHAAFPDGGLQHHLGGGVLPGGGGGLGGGKTGYRENGALGGLHNGLIGGGHAEIQRNGEIPAVDGLLLLDGLGKAAEEQGEDDA